MKLIILIVITLLLTDCGKKNSVDNKSEKREKLIAQNIPPSSTMQFDFYKAAKDDDGNEMEIYVLKNDLNIDSLKRLWIERRTNFRNFNSQIFCLVIFDSIDFAAFPNNPFSAYYGINEFRVKHIKAFYFFNSSNDFEKLDVYKNNMWDSVAE